MSHIPASAMPHAAPHHNDPEAAPVPEQAAATTMAPTGTATTDAPPVPAAPVAPGGSAKAALAPAHSGWSLAALGLGGAAIVAGALTYRSRKREA